MPQVRSTAAIAKQTIDGGYVMCEDDLKTGSLVGAYSYRVNGYDGWNKDVSERLRIPIY